MPLRAGLDGGAPGGHTALARMNFLPAAQQADDHGTPGFAKLAPAVHDIQQMARLGIGEADGAVLGLGDGVSGGPAALGFIDHHHGLGRGSAGKIVVAEARQRLDHALHALPCGTECQAMPGGVARQGFTQDVDKGRVAGEKAGAAPAHARGERQVQPA